MNVCQITGQKVVKLQLILTLYMVIVTSDMVD